MLFELIKLVSWIAVIVLLANNRKAVPVNMFWFMFASGILMLYAIEASMVTATYNRAAVRDIGNITIAITFIYLTFRYKSEYEWVKEYRKKNGLKI